MRGFIDWMINRMNHQNLFNSSVLLVKLTPGGSFQVYDDQKGQYHHLIRGLCGGNRVETTELITCIKNWIHPYENWPGFLEAAANPDLLFVFSNATEAGIACAQIDFPEACPLSFPAKLAAFLYERYHCFKGSFEKGLIIVPCELIEENGTTLKNITLQHAKDWQLEDDFAAWLENANIFADTLVDRIVAPPSEAEKPEIVKNLPFEDHLLDGSEPYHLFVIQGSDCFQRLSVIAKNSVK
jgi:tagaturonate reductase